MAKKDGKKKKDKEKAATGPAAEAPPAAESEPVAADAEPRSGAQDAVDAVRAAVERTLTGVTAEDAARRTRGLVDDVATAALRLRQNFEQARLQEEVRSLRSEVAALQRRIATLEEAAARRP